MSKDANLQEARRHFLKVGAASGAMAFTLKSGVASAATSSLCQVPIPATYPRPLSGSSARHSEDTSIPDGGQYFNAQQILGNDTPTPSSIALDYLKDVNDGVFGPGLGQSCLTSIMFYTT